MKGLIGKTEIEDALKRLDKLTQEEARMAAAQNLKVTHTVDDRVRGVADAVVAVDNRVAGVDDRVQLTQEEARMAAARNLKATHTVDDRVRGVSDAVVAVDNRVARIDDRVHQIAEEAERLSLPNLISADYRALPILLGNQLRESIYKWLSPPDPSTNYNIACGTRHKKMATWFFQGSIFQEWKSAGSLLWIHGKRLSRLLVNLTPSDYILYCSWVG